MIRKKAQSEVIITVLLILVAIAAVGIIAYFFISNARTSTGTAAEKASCVNLNFEIIKAENGSDIVMVRRNAGGDNIELKEVKVLIEGTSKNITSGDFTVLESKSFNVTSPLKTGQKVEVGVVLKSGTACDIKDTLRVS